MGFKVALCRCAQIWEIKDVAQSDFSFYCALGISLLWLFLLPGWYHNWLMVIAVTITLIGSVCSGPEMKDHIISHKDVIEPSKQMQVKALKNILAPP